MACISSRVVELAALLEVVLELEGPVEVILEAALAPTGDHQDVGDPGADRLLDHVLDGRLVDERQHLLGLGLGGRQEPGAQAGCRDDSFAYQGGNHNVFLPPSGRPPPQQDGTIRPAGTLSSRRARLLRVRRSETSMPTYEYRCKTCGEHVEVVQSFKDEPLTACPACGGPLRKVFGNIGIAFKGSGFYKNDSRTAAKQRSSLGSASSSSDGGGEVLADRRPSSKTSSDSGKSSSTPASPRPTRANHRPGSGFRQGGGRLLTWWR